MKNQIDTIDKRGPYPLKIRPSSSHAVLNGCLAAPILNTWVKPAKTTLPWLLEGTFAHHLAETCLKENRPPGYYALTEMSCVVDLDTPFEREEKFIVNETMVSGIAAYVEVLNQKKQKLSGDHSFSFIEKKVSSTYGSHYKFKDALFQLTVEGTVDYMLRTPSHLEVIDLKFGKGKEVFAKNNSQLIFYMLNTISQFDIDPKSLKTLKATIVQPRLTSGKIVKTWEIGDPSKWVEEQRAKIDQIIIQLLSQKHKLQYAPSPQNCKWCKGMFFCENLRERVREIMTNINKHPLDMPKDLFDFILENANGIKDFISTVQTHALAKALSGDVPNGFKLVNGGRAPSREWKKPAIVKMILEDKIRTGEYSEEDFFKDKTMKTPTQVEAILGTVFVAENSFVPEYTAPKILVHQTDRRPERVPAKVQFSKFLNTTKTDSSPILTKKSKTKFDLSDFDS